MMQKPANSRPFLLCMVTALLGACSTTDSMQPAKERVVPAGESARIDAALDRAAQNAFEEGDSGKSLVLLERLYKRNPSNETTAVKYAKALREAEFYNRASIVLSPFANAEGSSAGALAEYAGVQLALGHYANAERYAQQAIIKDGQNHQAFHYLGIALDAQGMHKKAERAFRKGLDYWDGDPTPIINNLALNLASQGYLPQALELLEKAMSVAPDRPELDRNYRIIKALQQTEAPRTPRPKKKPQ